MYTSGGSSINLQFRANWVASDASEGRGPTYHYFYVTDSLNPLKCIAVR